MTITLDTDDARQGHTGDGLRYVLGFSLALSLAAMGAVLVILF